VNNEPRVVIIGGGFGGLCAARGLAGAPVSVTLIDRRNYHLFRPMLYQVATGLLSADQISGPLRSILSRQANIEVLMDEVSGVDTDKRLVRLKQHSISYDYLVLATGIQYNYFGHDEWRRVAPGLESLDDADLIRGKILLAFERAEEMAALDHADTEGIRQLLTFVLVGAGTVGVEMASTLAEMSRMALKHDFRQIDPRDAQILLYEAAPRVLPTFPEHLSAKAQRHLESLGVKVYTNTSVTSVDADGVVANGQLARNPGNVVPRASRIRRRTSGRYLHRGRKHVPRSQSRLPSGARPQRTSSRRRDPARCSAPSSSHPARAGIPWRNARRRPCRRYTQRYSFDTFQAPSSVSNRANA